MSTSPLLLPSYLSLSPGDRDAYVLQPDLITAKQSGFASRYWTASGRVTSVQIGGRMLKDVTRFPSHSAHEEAFYFLMEECHRRGITRPSSYNDCFHHEFYTPRIRHSVNALFFPTFSGGWEEARVTGILPGKWYHYDMQSAYLWSGSQGLADTETFRWSDDLSDGIDGLYVLEMPEPRPDLPYPFNVRNYVMASRDEIEMYALDARDIVGGVSWTKTVSGEQVEQAIKSFTFWKDIGKTYWGRWCSLQPLHCHSKNGNSWQVRNPLLNLVWSHQIISRVKLRIWETAKEAAHIFVDSVIVPHTLSTSPDVGGWRLEAVYDGLRIKHAGFYGEADGDWIRTSGVKRN